MRSRWNIWSGTTSQSIKQIGCVGKPQTKKPGSWEPGLQTTVLPDQIKTLESVLSLQVEGAAIGVGVARIPTYLVARAAFAQ